MGTTPRHLRTSGPGTHSGNSGRLEAHNRSPGGGTVDISRITAIAGIFTLVGVHVRACARAS
jgi:hypothetical protein